MRTHTRAVYEQQLKSNLSINPVPYEQSKQISKKKVGKVDIVDYPVEHQSILRKSVSMSHYERMYFEKKTQNE